MKESKIDFAKEIDKIYYKVINERKREIKGRLGFFLGLIVGVILNLFASVLDNKMSGQQETSSYQTYANIIFVITAIGFTLSLIYVYRAFTELTNSTKLHKSIKKLNDRIEKALAERQSN